MSARIDIVNNALTWLGALTITSLEDDSNDALVMKTNYAIARDATLEAHEWSFAMKRWIPAADPEGPEWGADYRFRIPPDILRITAVERNVSGGINVARFNNTHSIGRDRQADYVVESGFILTNDSSIRCKGIRQIEDEGIFSNLFCHALSAKLAMVTCYAITESNVKWNAMSAMYQMYIQEAKSRDGLQGSNKRIRNRSLEDVR
jgi:hypothetical protein